MIKTKKLFFLIIFSFLFISQIQSMEVQSDKVCALDQKKLPKKSKRRRKKHINQKKSQDTKQDTKKSPDFENEITIQDIKILIEKDGNKFYLEKCNVLANFLLFQSWLVKHLEAIAFHSKELAETSMEEPICCFSASEDGVSIWGHDKSQCNCRYLQTPEAQALAKELAAPIVLSENFWNESQKINDTYNACKKLLESPNDEIRLVAKYIRNEISAFWIYTRLNDLWKGFLAFLSEIRFGSKDHVEEIKDFLKEDGLSNFFAKWMIQSKVFTVTQSILPNFILTMLDFLYLRQDFRDAWKSNIVFLDSSIAYDFHEEIMFIINKYKESETIYQGMYKIFLSQLPNGDEDYLSHCFIENINVLPKDLDVLLMPTDFIDTAEEEIRKHEFIATLIPKIRQNTASPKPKKKKSHSRNNKKQSLEKVEDALTDSVQLSDDTITSSVNDLTENEITQKRYEEAIELPRYARRILKWFNADYIKENSPDDNSIFYHTYCPLADYFTQKYGFKQLEQNASNAYETDAAYYIVARIKRKDGEVSESILKISFWQNGLCYHRGPRDTISLPEIYEKFKNSISNYDFPEIHNEQSIAEKRLIITDDYPHSHIYSDLRYKEGSHHIELYDSVHEITLTLFKL